MDNRCAYPPYCPNDTLGDTDTSMPRVYDQLSELTTQLSETIGLAEARAKDEGRLRSELKRLQITAARWGGAGGDFLFLLHQLHWLETALMELRCRHL